MLAAFRSNDGDDAIPAAVLTFLKTGGFADVESVASSTFTAKHASEALTRISRARQDVQDDIVNLSRNSTSRVEDWISQANQLHEDIEHSRATAHEIVNQHEHGKALQANVSDIQSKINLLRKETAFNRTLTARFENIKRIRGMLSRAREAFRDSSESDDSLLDLINDIETAVSSAAIPASSPLSTIIQDDLSGLQKDVSDLILRQWDSHVNIDKRCGLMMITDDSVKLGQIVSSLSRVQLLDNVLDKLAQDIGFLIISTIVRPENEHRVLQIDDCHIHVISQSSEVTAHDIFGGITSTVLKLKERLPIDVFATLMQRLSPPVISTLVSHHLTPSIPSDLPEMEKFQAVIRQVAELSNTLKDVGSVNIEELSSWPQNIPRLWLAQRKASSLNGVRAALASMTEETRQIDHTEKVIIANESTNTVASGAHVPDVAEDDGWNAGWSDDNDDDDDDGDEKTQNDQSQQNQKAKVDGDGDNEEEDWGWGDEETEGDAASKPVDKHAATSAASKARNEEFRRSVSQPAEVGRTEHYLITSIPDQIYDIMEKQIQDADALDSKSYSHLPIASATNGVRALPTVVLAMFRALAPLFYPQKLPTGQMYLYNDSSYLAEKLRRSASVNSVSKLPIDIDALERLGREAHDKELMSQKVVLRDLLDGTQGFSGCSSELMRSECENAIAMTVSRIRQLHREWQPILTHTSLLQSTGSLLTTIIDKIIVDIEDLSDIVESDSLVLVSLCDQVSKLEDLFFPQQRVMPPGESTGGDPANAVLPVTAGYVPNWLKFQYLINILESSLADIKYLWKEGGLQLDFTLDEIIDLVQALFADSGHRRKAIAELREL